MNSLDETLLSAYLDDELDPDDRVAVELALANQPHLERKLQRLAAVRDSVRALPKAALSHNQDLAGSILSRISEGSSEFEVASPRLLRFFESGRANRIAVWAAAAMLLIAPALCVAPRFASNPNSGKPANPPSVASNGSGHSANSPASNSAGSPSNFGAAHSPNPDSFPIFPSDPKIAPSPNPPVPNADDPVLSAAARTLKAWLAQNEVRTVSIAIDQPDSVDNRLKAVEQAIAHLGSNSDKRIRAVDSLKNSGFLVIRSQESDWNRIVEALNRSFKDQVQIPKPDQSDVWLKEVRLSANLKADWSQIEPGSALVADHPSDKKTIATLRPDDPAPSRSDVVDDPSPTPSQSGSESNSVKPNPSKPFVIMIVLTPSARP